MRTNRSIPSATVIPELACSNPAEMADWLCAAFGFTIRLRIGNHRIQLNIADGAAVLTEQSASNTVATPDCEHTGSMLVRVEDVNAHHQRAIAHGARILRPPADHPYGERQYTALDPSGRRWTFSQTIADVDPTSWGGTPEQL